MVISFAFLSICTIFADEMDIISMPIWAWVLFYVLVLIMLIIDLKSFGKKGQHEVSVGEALKMTAVWIGVSLIFCGGIWLYEGDEKAMEFLAGYLIEKSLSMDNLFVFLMLFSFFGIQRKYQHEVLFWGIFGALVLRSIFIFAGTAIINQFEWVLGVFGVFLIYTGIKMFGHQDDEHVDPSKNIFVKLFKKFFPVTDQMHDDKFFVIENGKRLATPLFIALLVIETTDVAFAVDSIPAGALFRFGCRGQILHLSEIRSWYHSQFRRYQDAIGCHLAYQGAHHTLLSVYLWHISSINGTFLYHLKSSSWRLVTTQMTR